MFHKLQLQSGGNKAIANGTLLSNAGENISISILEYGTAEEPNIEIHILIKFVDHISDLPRINSSQLVSKKHPNHFTCVCDINVANVKDGFTITEQDFLCAEYPGGSMTINFHLYSIPNSEMKGIHYTIFEHLD